MGLYETKEADYEYRKSMRESYNRGYEQGKADAKAEAIPVDWIEAEIKKLRDMDNGFASLSAGQIEAMLKKWREEQKHEPNKS